LIRIPVFTTWRQSRNICRKWMWRSSGGYSVSRDWLLQGEIQRISMVWRTWKNRVYPLWIASAVREHAFYWIFNSSNWGLMLLPFWAMSGKSLLTWLWRLQLHQGALIAVWELPLQQKRLTLISSRYITRIMTWLCRGNFLIVVSWIPFLTWWRMWTLDNPLQ